MNLKPATAKMTFTPKGVYGSAEVIPNLLLLRIITNSHADVAIACPAVPNALDVC